MSADDAGTPRRKRRPAITLTVSELAWTVLMVVIAAQSVCITVLLLRGVQR